MADSVSTAPKPPISLTELRSKRPKLRNPIEELKGALSRTQRPAVWITATVGAIGFFAALDSPPTAKA